jgi:hypothetical protein
VITKLVTATGEPEMNAVVLMFRSEPEVPTFISATNVPPDEVRRAQVVVPVADAFAVVIEFNVRTPPDDPGANVALQVRVARRFVTLPPVAGRDPS